MAIKRRLTKARAELSPAQQAFLLDAPLPEGLGFAEKMRFVWLTAEYGDHRVAVFGSESMPDASPTPRQLWEVFGGAVMAEWEGVVPPSGYRRFGPVR